jgi:hypothetical protein
MLRNEIPRVCYYFCSTEQNSEFVSLLRNGLEQNSKCLFLFWFHFGSIHGTEFRVVFSSAKWLRTEVREFASIYSMFHGTEFRAFFSSAEWFATDSESFLFRGLAGNPPEQTNCSVYSLFRGVIFCRKLPTQFTSIPRRVYPNKIHTCLVSNA